MGAEFVRGRVCQGPSLSGAEMSRNHILLSTFRPRTKIPVFLMTLGKNTVGRKCLVSFFLSNTSV